MPRHTTPASHVGLLRNQDGSTQCRHRRPTRTHQRRTVLDVYRHVDEGLDDAADTLQPPSLASATPDLQRTRNVAMYADAN
jgi:hypothetical protein